MIALVRGGGRFLSKALALALGIWVFSGSSAKSDDGGSDDPGQHAHLGSGVGTLGWGPPGYYPGFYGFGLSFHRGYGYGGAALGVGAEGGYPFYGGPGYPHPWPHLRRCGPIAPVAYYDGTGYPFTFQLPGPLVVTEPVAHASQWSRARPCDGGAVYPYNVGYGAVYRESYLSRELLRPLHGRGRSKRIIRRAPWLPLRPRPPMSIESAISGSTRSQSSTSMVCGE